MPEPVLHIYQSGILRPKRWRWRLIAGNGEIVAHGQGYKHKADCFQTARMVTQGHYAHAKIEWGVPTVV